MRIALRTQQIIAHETGVTNTIDPLGGSYFVEALTDRMEEQAYEYFAKIDELGGMVEAVKHGFPQREIADAAFELQREIDAGRRIVVGVNALHRGRRRRRRRSCGSTPRSSASRSTALRAVKARRDGAAVEARARPSCEAPRPASAQPDAAADRRRARRTPPRARSCRRSRRSGATTASARSSDASNPPTEAPPPEIRVVVAKPGLDGHDRGAKIIARALRDAGMEVIYTGLHQTPEQIVETAIQEDADAVGLSILSGAHMTLVPRVWSCSRAGSTTVVTVGGTIPRPTPPS